MASCLFKCGLDCWSAAWYIRGDTSPTALQFDKKYIIIPKRNLEYICIHLSLLLFVKINFRDWEKDHQYNWTNLHLCGLPYYFQEAERWHYNRLNKNKFDQLITFHVNNPWKQISHVIWRNIWCYIQITRMFLEK